jgi:hypothetical protein
MGRVIGMAGTLVAFVSVGTVLTAAIVGGYLWSRGDVDAEKLSRMAAIMRGEETPKLEPKKVQAPSGSSEQPSFEEVQQSRAAKARHLELREQEIQSGLEIIRYEQRKLTEEMTRYDRLKTAFEQLLEDKKDTELTAGRENVRSILETMRPKQAKEEILQMLAAGEEQDVVAILVAMPIANVGKIVGEFKTPDEAKKLDELLREIRLAKPQVAPIDEAREELKQFQPKNPSPENAKP